LVDFTHKEGKVLLEYLIQKDVHQKIITMSDNFECSEAAGCDFCIKHYKKRRVFKPLNLKEVGDLILNFEDLSCSYMHKFNNIMQLLDRIIEQYDHFLYDFEQQRIYPKSNISQTYLLEEVLDMTNLLQENNIKFQVDEKFNINLLF
jgi:hypothetical protein